MLEWPNLTRILAGIPWAIVGGVATRLYMPERFTRDLDIVVLGKDMPLVHDRLLAAGYTKEGDLTIGGSGWRAPDGTPVDVIAGDDSWWPEALDAASQNRDEHGAPIVTMNYLILMKMKAARQQDMGDVGRILSEASDEQLQRVRRTIDAYAADLREDMESLIILGRLERQN